MMNIWAYLYLVCKIKTKKTNPPHYIWTKERTATRIYYCYKSLKKVTTFGAVL